MPALSTPPEASTHDGKAASRKTIQAWTLPETPPNLEGETVSSRRRLAPHASLATNSDASAQRDASTLAVLRRHHPSSDPTTNPQGGVDSRHPSSGKNGRRLWSAPIPSALSRPTESPTQTSISPRTGEGEAAPSRPHHSNSRIRAKRKEKTTPERSPIHRAWGGKKFVFPPHAHSAKDAELRQGRGRGGASQKPEIPPPKTKPLKTKPEEKGAEAPFPPPPTYAPAVPQTPRQS
jgi:hypothetical protein